MSKQSMHDFQQRTRRSESADSSATGSMSGGNSSSRSTPIEGKLVRRRRRRAPSMVTIQSMSATAIPSSAANGPAFHTKLVTMSNVEYLSPPEYSAPPLRMLLCAHSTRMPPAPQEAASNRGHACYFSAQCILEAIRGVRGVEVVEGEARTHCRYFPLRHWGAALSCWEGDLNTHWTFTADVLLVAVHQMTYHHVICPSDSFALRQNMFEHVHPGNVELRKGFEALSAHA